VITSTFLIPCAFSTYLAELAFSSASIAFSLVLSSSALDFKTCFDLFKTSRFF